MSHHKDHRRVPVLIGLTAAGGLAMASVVVPASAESVPKTAPGRRQWPKSPRLRPMRHGSRER